MPLLGDGFYICFEAQVDLVLQVFKCSKVRFPRANHYFKHFEPEVNHMTDMRRKKTREGTCLHSASSIRIPSNRKFLLSIDIPIGPVKTQTTSTTSLQLRASGWCHFEHPILPLTDTSEVFGHRLAQVDWEGAPKDLLILMTDNAEWSLSIQHEVSHGGPRSKGFRISSNIAHHMVQVQVASCAQGDVIDLGQG